MFEFTHITPDTVRVQHDGPVTVESTRQFRAFLIEFRGRLLVDLRNTPPADMRRELLRVRSMLPQTACFGPGYLRPVCEQLPGKDVYRHELRHFETEAEALAWLGVEHDAKSGESAVAA